MTTNELHFADLAREVDPARPGESSQGIASALVVVYRDVAGEMGPPFSAADVASLELLDSGLQEVPAFGAGWVIREPQAAAAWASPLAPGGYVLRLNGPGGPALDHSLWLAEGWTTYVFLSRGDRGPQHETVALHMLPLGSPILEDRADERDLERALRALRQGRTDALDGVPGGREAVKRNPMLGIVAAHLMLLGGQDANRLTELVAYLGGLLPGHPDVRALESAVDTTGTGAVKPVDWAPTLMPSYQALLRANAERPGVIVSGSVAERVAPNLVTEGVTTAWRPLTPIRSALPADPPQAPVAAPPVAAPPVAALPTPRVDSPATPLVLPPQPVAPPPMPQPQPAPAATQSQPPPAGTKVAPIAILGAIAAVVAIGLAATLLVSRPTPSPSSSPAPATAPVDQGRLTVPSVVTFPSTPVRVAAKVPVAVTNDGDADLTIVDLRQLSGTEDFAIDAQACRGLTLQPTESCELAITFTPTTFGDRRGDVSVVMLELPPVSIALTGVGVASP